MITVTTSRMMLIAALVHPTAFALMHLAGTVPSHLVQAAWTGMHWNIEAVIKAVP
jgi:hypothetical protein